MSAGFFIEFRLRGYARKYTDWVKARATTKSKVLRIKRLKTKKEVPHITLFGPAQTNDLSQIVSEVSRLGNKYTLVPFTIGGFSRFENRSSKVIYLDVVPSLKLDQFRSELAQRLFKLSTTDSPFDDKRKFKFHCTIKKFIGISDASFEALCDYLEGNCSLSDFEQYIKIHKISLLGKLWNFVKQSILAKAEEDKFISQHLLRVTILGKGGRIRNEYDLVLKKLLNRQQALSQYWWRITIGQLKRLL
jgi:2'-5' RNA ligase